MEQRVLVCGGRDFNDRAMLYSVLDMGHEANPIVDIIHGAAQGADLLAAEWAKARGVNAKAFPPDWNAHGKAAGPIRNRQMLSIGKPHIVLAFPGGAGTRNMVEQALGANVPTIIVTKNGQTKRIN